MNDSLTAVVYKDTEVLFQENHSMFLFDGEVTYFQASVVVRAGFNLWEPPPYTHEASNCFNIQSQGYYCHYM